MQFTIVKMWRFDAAKNQIFSSFEYTEEYMKKSPFPSLKGKLSIHNRGFGFVSPIGIKHEDVFIPLSKIKGAIDGDIVEIKVTGRSNKGFEGTILKVLERKTTTIVGTVIRIHKGKGAILTATGFAEERTITLQLTKKEKLKIGDRVLGEIIRVTKEEVICQFKKRFGSIDDALIDTEVAIHEFHIPREFSPQALQEAHRFKEIPLKDINRIDLTNTTAFTIDPVNARDYDDALSIQKDAEGHYHLGVHIADVSAFVPVGSILDREAYERGNSTYFIDQVVPMLPKELSDDLCSLKEKVARLTITVMMKFDSSGHLESYDIFRSIIKSAKRFTYESAKEVLDGKQKSPLLLDLNLLVELASLLKNFRKKRGSVELSLEEIRLKMGLDGVPTGSEWIEYDITHQMVEEFMLKANETVAKHLVKQGKAAIFRIHEEPEAETLSEFYAYARLLGFHTPQKENDQAIVAIFEAAQKSPLLEQLAIRYIRSMKLAIYSENNLGHYGLQLEHYTHFTSPIRRYSDLVVHRLLFDDSYAPSLQEMSVSCTEKERRSFKAEMSVLKLKKLRYLQHLTKDNPNQIFEACITNIRGTGIYFDITFLGFEGFIHISEIGDDYYRFFDDRKTLMGEKSGQTFQIGEQIRVILETIDLLFSEATWKILH